MHWQFGICWHMQPHPGSHQNAENPPARRGIRLATSHPPEPGRVQKWDMAGTCDCCATHPTPSCSKRGMPVMQRGSSSCMWSTCSTLLAASAVLLPPNMATPSTPASVACSTRRRSSDHQLDSDAEGVCGRCAGRPVLQGNLPALKHRCTGTQTGAVWHSLRMNWVDIPVRQRRSSAISVARTLLMHNSD